MDNPAANGPSFDDGNTMNGSSTDYTNNAGYNGSYKGRVAMNVPERIVLSAGYDGDDNTNANLNGDALNDGPMFPTDAMLGGMRTPPNMLTIDDSTSLYPRSSNKGGRHTEGDGSDHVAPIYKLQKKVGNDDAGSDAESDDPSLQRALAPVGQDDMYLYHAASEAEMSYPNAVVQLQRKVYSLEKELHENKSNQFYWKMFLLALSVINPVVVTIFMNSRKR